MDDIHAPENHDYWHAAQQDLGLGDVSGAAQRKDYGFENLNDVNGSD